VKLGVFAEFGAETLPRAAARAGHVPPRLRARHRATGELLTEGTAVAVNDLRLTTSWTISSTHGSSFESRRRGVSRVTAVETATHAYLARNCAVLQVALRTDS
jgi:hypothetical protein